MSDKVTTYTAGVAEVRAKMLNEAYIAAMIMGLPICITLFIGSVNVMDTVFASIILTLFLSFGVIYFMRHKIPYQFRINYLILLTFLLGTDAFLRWGLMGGGTMLFMVGTILVSLHFNVRITQYIFYASIVLFTLLGIAMTAKWTLDFYNYTTFDPLFNRYGWTINIVLYSLLASAIIRSVLALNRYMHTFVGELGQQNRIIQVNHSKLQLQEQELKQKYQDLVDKEHKIAQLAYFDQLTGLPNRHLLRDDVQDTIRENNKAQGTFAVVLFDLDNFIRVNNMMGHAIGDKILRSITKKLHLILDENMTLYRMGGDEFTLLIHGTGTELDLDAIMSKILETFFQKYTVHNAVYHLSCSAGVALYPQHGTSYETLLKNADTALFNAKSSGKNRYILFDSSFQQSNDERIRMEGHLEKALKSNELQPYFQPKYDCRSGRIESFEALARWNSSEYGYVSPSVFIPLLEDTGMIIPFGLMMMRSSLMQLRFWHELGWDHMTVAVNVSTLQITQQDFVKNTLEIIENAGMHPRDLEIELTESVLVKDFGTVRDVLLELSSHGIRVALDDFGTGFSSLTYLKELPISILKIDRSFVEHLEPGSKDTMVLGSIIDLAHKLNMEVVAEGVETDAQNTYLIHAGCDFLQGYYYSRPLPGEQIPMLLRDGCTEKTCP